MFEPGAGELGFVARVELPVFPGEPDGFPVEVGLDTVFEVPFRFALLDEEFDAEELLHRARSVGRPCQKIAVFPGHADRATCGARGVNVRSATSGRFARPWPGTNSPSTTPLPPRQIPAPWQASSFHPERAFFTVTSGFTPLKSKYNGVQFVGKMAASASL